MGRTAITVGLYESDYYAWTRQQAAALRRAPETAVLDLDLDLANLAEELEAMGRRERREMQTRLCLVLRHLLKFQVQSALRSRTWMLSIRNERRELGALLDDSPSLRAEAERKLPAAYVLARDETVCETGLHEALFDAACPWALEEVLAFDFLPTLHQGLRDG